jgi:hypothetical protein
MGLRRNEVKWLHNASSSDKLMPSLPPSEGVSPTYALRIRAIGMAITVVGLPLSTNNPSNIVPPRILLPNNFVVVSFDNIVPLLPPPATCWGSTMPLTSLKQLLEHSPCRSVTFWSMGGEWHSPHHFVPFASTWEECTPLAGCPQLPTGATPHSCQRTMVPSPVTTGAARPSQSLAHPFLPTRSSPSHPPTMGRSAALTARRACAIDQGLQHLAYKMSSQDHADAHAWVLNTVNAVALELQYWCQ